MGRSSKRPLSRDRAWSCVTLNFSLAGLGTLKAGRIFAGVSQLLTVFVGFFLLLTWMFKWIYRVFQAQVGETLSPQPAGWLWKWGVACFIVSYSWMLFTCVSLMRQAKVEDKAPANVPPRLADLPKKNSENQ